MDTLQDPLFTIFVWQETASSRLEQGSNMLLAKGDILQGQFEVSNPGGAGRFEIRIHSPIRGSAFVSDAQ